MGYRFRAGTGTTNRKIVRLNTDQIDALQRKGGGMSAQLRDMTVRFLKKGSEYRKPTTRPVGFVIDRDLAERAETKAIEEYGVPLSEILRFEIDRA